MDAQGLTQRGLQMEKVEDVRKRNSRKKEFLPRGPREIAPSSAYVECSVRMLCTKQDRS